MQHPTIAWLALSLTAILVVVGCGDKSPPPPQILAINPDLVYETVSSPATITGTHFFNVVTTKLDDPGPILVNNIWRAWADQSELTDVTWKDAQTLEVIIPADLTPDVYDVVIESPARQTDTLVDGLTVIATPTPPPVAGDKGDGHDGPLVVPTGTQFINTCASVTSAQLLTVEVDSAVGLTAGTMVLVHQVIDELNVASGAAAPVGPAGSIGLWEVARIASATATTITLETPLANVYTTSAPDSVAQACSVPEYTTVDVEAPGTLAALPFDGLRGGVVAFFADNNVSINGIVHANEFGFRGGQVFAVSGKDSVTDLDTTGGEGGGKGEWLDGGSRSLEGRGNYANAGGGGNANAAGGGGGGNFGKGGFGGKQDLSDGDNSSMRGMPGSNVAFSSNRLSMGGGGGAGQAHDNVGDAGLGGNGGGIVLMFVEDLGGNGNIAADGGTGGDGNQGGAEGEGAGGGGAGGTILVFANSSSFAGSVSVKGGAGGDVNSTSDLRGPGGGGGGGSIYLTGVTGGTAAATAGANGVDGGSAHGSKPGNDGSVIIDN